MVGIRSLIRRDSAKFEKKFLKMFEIEQVSCVSSIKRIVSGNLFLLKVTREETLFNNSFHETLGRS